jgi:hypothetical protein
VGGSDWPANSVPTPWQDSSTFRTQRKKEGWAYFPSPLSNLMASVGCAFIAHLPNTGPHPTSGRRAKARSRRFIAQPLPPMFCWPRLQTRPPGGRSGAGRRASPLIPAKVCSWQTFSPTVRLQTRLPGGKSPLGDCKGQSLAGQWGAGRRRMRALIPAKGFAWQAFGLIRPPVGCASAHHHSIQPGIRKSRQK